MTLGEKIRNARLDLGLSQRQLCGATITRNMLSQIDSGKAKPSMTTLQYLSAQLQKPVSFFLEEGVSAVDGALEEGREAFRQGKFRQALDAMQDCKTKTEEAVCLEYLCLLELSREAIRQEKLPYARQLLEKAAFLQTPYITACMERERQLLYLQAGGEGTIPTEERPLLLQAQQALAAKDALSAARYLEACNDRNAYWALLRGKTCFLAGDFSAALEVLKQAEKDFPREVLPLLEACCKELEDYKQAYHYACLQR